MSPAVSCFLSVMFLFLFVFFAFYQYDNQNNDGNKNYDHADQQWCVVDELYEAVLCFTRTFIRKQVPVRLFPDRILLLEILPALSQDTSSMVWYWLLLAISTRSSPFSCAISSSSKRLNSSPSR